MGGGRLPSPMGAYDEDEGTCRPLRVGEGAGQGRPPLSLGFSGPHDHPVLDTPGPTGANDHAAQLAECRLFIDPLMQERNYVIEKALLDGADAYYKAADLRWFFAHAHGMITKQINAHLATFEDPNALLKLNIHFAEEFIRAIDGQAHQFWKNAFRICAALQKNEMALAGEAEACGAAMAKVHIHVDLANALREVGCISPRDYGNMLVFVNRGSLAALVRLRGRTLGAAQAMLVQIGAPMMNLEVKAWRNAVFEASCAAKVPDPTMQFPLK